MIKTIERRSFHTWDKDSGIVNFPNRFELRSDDGKKFLGIYTAKRNGKWHLGLNISLTDRSEINRTFSGPCNFKHRSYVSEEEIFSEVLEYLFKPSIKLPKKWLNEVKSHLLSLHGR